MPSTHLFGIDVAGFKGFYLCAVTLILAYYLAMRITRSPFGMALRAIRSNQSRMNYTGFSPRPYTLPAFVLSGLYAGLAGALLAAIDPLAGPARNTSAAYGGGVLVASP